MDGCAPSAKILDFPRIRGTSEPRRGFVVYSDVKRDTVVLDLTALEGQHSRTHASLNIHDCFAKVLMRRCCRYMLRVVRHALTPPYILFRNIIVSLIAGGIAACLEYF